MLLMINNLKNYLYDKNYFINIYDDFIHVFNYKSLDDYSDNYIKFRIDDSNIIIKGKDFQIKQMLKNEVLIEGEITSLEKENG